MNWGGWHEFWDMGGRGMFVWSAYGLCVLAVAVEVWTLRARLARARRRAAAGPARRA